MTTLLNAHTLSPIELYRQRKCCATLCDEGLTPAQVAITAQTIGAIKYIRQINRRPQVTFDLGSPTASFPITEATEATCSQLPLSNASTVTVVEHPNPSFIHETAKDTPVHNFKHGFFTIDMHTRGLATKQIEKIINTFPAVARIQHSSRYTRLLIAVTRSNMTQVINKAIAKRFITWTDTVSHMTCHTEQCPQNMAYMHMHKCPTSALQHPPNPDILQGQAQHLPTQDCDDIPCAQPRPPSCESIPLTHESDDIPCAQPSPLFNEPLPLTQDSIIPCAQPQVDTRRPHTATNSPITPMRESLSQHFQASRSQTGDTNTVQPLASHDVLADNAQQPSSPPNTQCELESLLEPIIQENGFTILPTHNASVLHTSSDTIPPALPTCKRNYRLQLGLTYNPDAVRNLTTHDVIDQVLHILSYGPKFAVPMTFQEKDYKDFLECVRIVNDVYFLPFQRQIILDATNTHIRNLTSTDERLDAVREYYRVALKDTKTFFQHHHDIMAVQDDKLKTTVIMYKQDYVDKIMLLLNDTNTYQKINVSFNKAYINKNAVLFKQWVSAGLVTLKMAQRQRKGETRVPHIYGRVKTHKPDLPLRPVVCTIRTPGYFFNQYLTRTWSYIPKGDPINVENSIELKQLIDNLQLAPNEQLFSIDVTSMFTNIDVHHAMRLIKKRLDENLNIIKDKTQREVAARTNALLLKTFLIVNQHFTEIEFNGERHKQIKGFRMGTSSSNIAADVVLKEYLTYAISKAYEPSLIAKYVDDIFLATTLPNAHRLLAALNEFTSIIKARDHPLPTSTFTFTIEQEVNRKINFLDMTIIRNENGTLATRWYQKHGSSERIISWKSTHQRNQKLSIVKQYALNMFRLTSPQFHKDTKTLAMHIFLKNDYPSRKAKEIIDLACEEATGNLPNKPRLSTQGKEFARISLPAMQNLTAPVARVCKYLNPDLIIPAVPYATLREHIYEPAKRPFNQQSPPPKRSRSSSD